MVDLAHKQTRECQISRAPEGMQTEETFVECLEDPCPQGQGEAFKKRHRTRFF